MDRLMDRTVLERVIDMVGLMDGLEDKKSNGCGLMCRGELDSLVGRDRAYGQVEG